MELDTWRDSLSGFRLAFFSLGLCTGCSCAIDIEARAAPSPTATITVIPDARQLSSKLEVRSYSSGNGRQRLTANFAPSPGVMGAGGRV